jgi:hypothetical protein
MRKPNSLELKAFFILSILAPLGILISLRLTGILKEPPTPETITVETVSWNMGRPSDFRHIDELVNNSYTDDVTSLNLVIYVVSYYENDQTWAGFDVLLSMVLVNISVSEGFVELLFVNFTELDKHAALDIHEDMDNIEVVNFEVAKIVDWNWVFGRNAYIETTSINRPKNAYLKFPLGWMFKDPNNTNHKLTITLEATLFNGITYQKIKVPIQMEVSQS